MNENPQTAENTLQASPRRIAIATAIAFVVSLVVLLAFVMPAELGVDPLGTGRVLGLNALSRGEDTPFEAQLDIHRVDHAEFILEPFQSAEYKYLMDADSSMVFSWDAGTDVYYDFHAEPAGLGEEYTVSYEVGVAQRSMGSFHAPFTGIHGWFWENRSFETVTIRLHSAGFFISSTVFQDGGTFDRELQPVMD